MSPCKPVCHRRVVCIRYTDISEDTMLHPFPQRFHNRGSRTEIHIGYPHRQYICISGRIPFIGIRTSAWNYFIEVVLHISIKTSQFVPKFQFTISRCFEILVQDDCPETFGNNAPRAGILHAVNRAFNRCFHTAVFKSEVSVLRHCTIFHDQIMCIAKWLCARNPAIYQTQVFRMPAQIFSVQFGIIDSYILRIQNASLELITALRISTFLQYWNE